LRRRLWFGPALIVPVILSGAFFARAPLTHAAHGSAPSRFDPYLHRTTGELADPVNLIFRGGDVDTVAQAVRRVLDWPQVQGSAMVFYDRGLTRDTAYQFGMDLGNGARQHLRLERIGTADGQPYVLAGVHRDDTLACGHVGHFFDQERDVVAGAFAAAGYHVTLRRLENTQPGPQCDGSFSAGDGTVAIIDLGDKPTTSLRAIAPVGGPFPPIDLALP
jgi:hypothetical protein